VLNRESNLVLLPTISLKGPSAQVTAQLDAALYLRLESDVSGESVVKTDDSELEKSRQEMFKRVENMNALTIAVLRSHLLAEQCMGDYILASGAKPKWLRKATFFSKMGRCRHLAKDEGDAELWGVLDTANQLRNTIAHSLSSEKIAEKMKQLRERYFACLTKDQAAGLADQPDGYVAKSACLTCAGFIATLTDRLPAKKSVDGGAP
jgi:hypothetical protein